MDITLVLAALFASSVGIGCSDGAPAAGDCCNGDTVVVVSTQRRVLTLCERGTAVATFPVALGSGGLGKQREGDARTPLGRYPLGAPRASRQFGTFVPVAYPTPAQARAGLTGGAIGIHGPPRAFTFAGRLNTATNWTAGCIAVGSDNEVISIAAWLRAHPSTQIQID